MDLRIRAFFASILNTIPLGEERDFHFQNYLRIVKFPELFHPTWMVVHNHERYLKIKQDALELGKNVQKLTEKTKYCTNKIPHGTRSFRVLTILFISKDLSLLCTGIARISLHNDSVSKRICPLL